jgi:hypothetical protein
MSMEKKLGVGVQPIIPAKERSLSIVFMLVPPKREREPISKITREIGLKLWFQRAPA